MSEPKKLEVKYLGEIYQIIFNDNKPKSTIVYNNKNEKCERIARKLLREEAKKINLSNDGYLYDKNGIELTTHMYFKKIYNKKNNLFNILNLGFKKEGEFFLIENNLKYRLKFSNKKYEKNVLYLFVINNKIKYIGKTTKGIKQRLYQYCNPEISQKTNIKINHLIKNYLIKKENILIYLFEDNNITYKNIKINLPASLEDTLIEKFKPEWNIIGK